MSELEAEAEEAARRAERALQQLVRAREDFEAGLRAQGEALERRLERTLEAKVSATVALTTLCHCGTVALAVLCKLFFARSDC